MKNETKSIKKGRIKELKKIIKDLQKSKLESPFNPYFLRNTFIDKYKIRLYQLERILPTLDE